MSGDRKENTMSKETRHKLRLIRKYAKIRIKRFWREWGISKEEFGYLITSMAIIAFVASLTIIL